MKAKLIALIVVFLLFSGGVGYFIRSAQVNSHSTVGASEISGRATEFIQKEQEKGAGTWNESNFEKESDNSKKEIGFKVENECFSFVLPFSTTDHTFRKERETCVFETRIMSPPSRLVMSVYDHDGTFEDDSGVSMRKRFPDKYKEEKFVSKNFQQSMLFHEDESLVLFASNSQKMVTLAFNSLLQPERLDKEKISLLLESVVLVK